MPAFDLGYRPWTGERVPPGMRWIVITRTGAALAWKSKFVRRLCVVAWLPVIYFGFAFFMYEWVVEKTLSTLSNAERQALVGALTKRGTYEEEGDGFGRWFLAVAEAFGLRSGSLERIAEDPKAARKIVWAHFLYAFMRMPQLLLLVGLVGLVAPPLISQDVRTRAFLLYFSKPLSRTEYLLGKGAVVAAYIAAIVLAPSLVLYLFGVGLSSSLDVLGRTWELPFRVVAAFLGMAIPVSALALALSSITSEWRFAAISWYGVWILGAMAHSVLSAVGGDWQYLSLFHALGEIQASLLGIQEWTDAAISSLTLAGAVTVVSIWIAYRRISAPMRV